MQWITKEDHRFKTLVDVRECRKMKRSAGKHEDEEQRADLVESLPSR